MRIEVTGKAKDEMTRKRIEAAILAFVATLSGFTINRGMSWDPCNKKISKYRLVQYFRNRMAEFMESPQVQTMTIRIDGQEYWRK